MSERIWDLFVNTMMVTFMPLVCTYFAITSNVFLNVSAQNATGFEQIGNTILAPVQYILVGKVAIPKPDGSWQFVQRFDYSQSFWIKTISSALALPPSLALGTATKALGFLSKKTKARHASILATVQSKETRSNIAYYKEVGLQVEPSNDILLHLGCQRKEGDENVLAVEKKALQDITSLLNKAEIPWWVDCGTCLGAYRYGGVIPWDGDVDIAVLLPDFDNVCHALNELDPNKYTVQDWSTRDHPNTYLKVYIKESGTMVDIYHFAIARFSKELHYILSLETNLFFPEWWKQRERHFKVPVAFDTLFPLKRAMFDGIEVFVPNDTQKYLQRCYGENLDPVKVFDPITNRYERDLTHPYWKRSYAH